jgi:hypothetical protein
LKLCHDRYAERAVKATRAVGMRGRRRREVLVLVVALGPLLSGCDDTVGPAAAPLEELEAHRRLWARTRPDIYVYTVLRSCECPVGRAGPVRVTVDGPAVVARVYKDSSEPVPEQVGEVFPSVEGLFDIARRGLVEGRDVIVRYDHHSGVPLEVWVGPGVGAEDDILGYRVTIPPARPAELR